MSRIQFRGLLNVDKPSGWSSRRVVDRVLRIVRPAKVGHAGTLDPMATGVLVICLGRATRLAEYILQQSKSYRARFRLGVESDTDDITGNVVEVPGAPYVSRAHLQAVLPEFLGEIEQVPPRFSAIHVKGRRAHEMARKGIAVEIPPKTVQIHRLELVAFHGVEFELEIECGSGTYVRSLGRDLGARLNSAAVLCSLVRTRVGPFRVERAVPAEDLHRNNLGAWCLPTAMSVDHLPKHEMTSEEGESVTFGRSLPCPQPGRFADGQHVALLKSTGDLQAVAEYRSASGRLVPRKVLLDAG